MIRKIKREKVDNHLLETIYKLQWEWKRIQKMLENSIEPSEESIFQEKIAKAKFVFLWQEARYLNIHAIKRR